MRILLAYPPTTLRGQDPTLPAAFPPLGLAYIAAVLEENGYEVKILDALALGIENVTKSNGVTRIGISEDDIKRYLRDYAYSRANRPVFQSKPATIPDEIGHPSGANRPPLG